MTSISCQRGELYALGMLYAQSCMLCFYWLSAGVGLSVKSIYMEKNLEIINLMQTRKTSPCCPTTLSRKK